MGTLSRRTTLEDRVASAVETASTPEPAASLAPAPERVGGPGAVPMSQTQYVAPPTHVIGVGGRTSRQSHDDFGLSARVWSRKRLGVQVDASRSTLVSAQAPGKVTSMEFAPSVIYSLRDRVTDYVWIRPYVGAGGAFTQAKLKLGTPEDLAAPSDTTLGFRSFGGGEFTFPAVARFAISAVVGYLWSREPFPGFDPTGIQFSLAGHWYVR
jgi:hypothetical protein